MKKMIAGALTILAAGLLAAAPVMAETASRPGQPPGPPPGTPGLERGAGVGMQEGVVHSANEIIGLEVRDRQGQRIGELRDLMVDMSDNSIAFGVVRVEQNDHLVPWNAITSDHENAFLTLDADRRTLTTAPSPPTPAMIDQELAREVHDHYGVSPYWEDATRGEQMKRHPWHGLPGQVREPRQPMGGSGSR